MMALVNSTAKMYESGFLFFVWLLVWSLGRLAPSTAEESGRLEDFVLIPRFKTDRPVGLVSCQLANRYEKLRFRFVRFKLSNHGRECLPHLSVSEEVCVSDTVRL